MSPPDAQNPPAPEQEIPLALEGSWPLQIRNFLVQHLEFLFVGLVAVGVVLVFYLSSYKIAFLNFFYLPVMTAAYFMGKRKAVLGAVLCVLSGFLFAWFNPNSFAVVGTRIDAMMILATWGGFLVLASAAVGSLHERLARGFEQTRQLYEELKRSRVAEEMKEKVEKTLYATMDPVVAKLATEGKLRFEKREISVMFTDLTNFTTFSDKNPPDVVLEELNGFLGKIEPVVELFRGHIDKYMGDGVMVEFGAPIDYDRHALMAVLAGIKMQQKMKEAELPWRLRVGLATGSAIIGMLGVRRQAYSALGDRVNVAKRLEEICEAGKIYIDEATFRGVQAFVTAKKLRNMGYGRREDQDLVERLGAVEEKLLLQGDDPELLYEAGKISFELRDATSAIRYFERALANDPQSTKIKLAYADANFKKDEFEKIQLKGKLQKVTVYEVVGIKDRWADAAVIPPAVAEKYRAAEGQIEIPEDLVLAVEALDGSVGNSRVTALLSYAIADRLGLAEDMKKNILLAGYLQDLGKEAVPHHILNRIGSLSEQESKLVRRYVLESVSACKRIGYVDPRLLEIVGHHHEAWDGTGYPDGLKGEAIPLGARITSVAEAYSALTSWRPYHEAWDARVALSEIRKDVEKSRFDPKVAEALFDLLRPAA